MHVNSCAVSSLVSSETGDMGTLMTDHLGQLSLLPSARWQMSTGQVAVAVGFGQAVDFRCGITVATHDGLHLQAHWPQKG